MRKHQIIMLTLSIGIVTLFSVSLPSANPPNAADDAFNKHVAPVLQQRCLQCHSGRKARGGLDLSTRKNTLTGGDSGPAIVPGHADKSLLFKMISGANPSMPQRGDALSKKQIADVRQWINEGAKWSESLTLKAKPLALAANDWWSMRPLSKSPVPKVDNEKWVRTPIDAFILAKLKEKGLSPSPEVDRVTFIRRAKFDLHGLLPTPEEVEAFINDKLPNAFERLIDRLLESPLYGERWGRFWLDIAHYADTHGFDKDKRRLWAWLFRDWVIQAFNIDIPYHRFVTMQLAGDVAEPDNPDGIIATGFVVAGPWDFVGHVELREGTVDKMKTRLLDRDDMVTNVMSTFQSTTAHCARCHDHKFDPISQKEYYQLQAVFAGVERGDRKIFRDKTRKQLAKLQEQMKLAMVRQGVTLQEIGSLTSPELAELDVRLKQWKLELSKLPSVHSQTPSPTNGYHSRIEKTQNTEKWVQVDLGKSVALNQIRLLPARPTDFRDSPGFGFPARFTVSVADQPDFKQATTLALHRDEDYPNPGDNAVVIPVNGKKARYVRVTAHKLWKRNNDYVFALAELQVDVAGKNMARGAKVTALDSIEAGRWSRRHLVDDFDSRHKLPDLSSPRVAAVVNQRNSILAQIQKAERKRQVLRNNLIPASLQQAREKNAAEIAALKEKIQQVRVEKVYAVKPIAPRPIHQLKRGNVEKKLELVAPAALSMIPNLNGKLSIANPKNEGQRRLALAKWITDKNNVLTWRSIVNRVWQHHFGQGLVNTPNDFGKNGSRPTHPQLLDWLATEFRDDGQSFKKLHKMIMLSSVYRQASQHNKACAKIDAGNQFLWKMNRRKLDAEAIRDSVLAVSGKMNYERGGPGYNLFRFKEDHSPVYDHSDVKFINDPKTYRRTVYRFVVRSVPNPFLETLDCADPNISVPKRNETLTALQALSLLNNPFMVKQSEYFAERLQKASKDPGKQIDRAFQLAFNRLPNENERRAVSAYRKEHGLVNTCRVLFNANEFMFVD